MEENNTHRYQPVFLYIFNSSELKAKRKVHRKSWEMRIEERERWCMVNIPHGEGEIEEWMRKRKKLKAVVGSNRVLLHGKLAEQLHHPFFPINTATSEIPSCVVSCVRERNLVWSVMWWNFSPRCKWKIQRILFTFFWLVREYV